jgi:hypothetical protein
MVSEMQMDCRPSLTTIVPKIVSLKYSRKRRKHTRIYTLVIGIYLPGLDHQYTKNYPDGGRGLPNSTNFYPDRVWHFQKFLQFLSGHWINDFSKQVFRGPA